MIILEEIGKKISPPDKPSKTYKKSCFFASKLNNRFLKLFKQETIFFYSAVCFIFSVLIIYIWCEDEQRTEGKIKNNRQYFDIASFRTIFDQFFLKRPRLSEWIRLPLNSADFSSKLPPLDFPSSNRTQQPILHIRYFLKKTEQFIDSGGCRIIINKGLKNQYLRFNVRYIILIELKLSLFTPFFRFNNFIITVWVGWVFFTKCL